MNQPPTPSPDSDHSPDNRESKNTSPNNKNHNNPHNSNNSSDSSSSDNLTNTSHPDRESQNPQSQSQSQSQSHQHKFQLTLTPLAIAAIVAVIVIIIIGVARVLVSKQQADEEQKRRIEQSQSQFNSKKDDSYYDPYYDYDPYRDYYFGEELTFGGQSNGDQVEYSIDVNGVILDKWSIFYQDGDKTYVIYDEYLPNETGLAENAGLEIGYGEYDAYGVFSDVSRYDLLNRLNDSRNTGSWNELLDGQLLDLGASAKGGVDLETWVKSWNSKGYKPLTLSTIDFSDGTQGYRVNDSDMLNLSLDPDGYNDALFFPVIEGNSKSSNPYYGYWIASLSGMGNGYLMIASDDGNLGDNLHGFHDAEGVGIRPVLIIPTKNLQETSPGSKIWGITSNLPS